MEESGLVAVDDVADGAMTGAGSWNALTWERSSGLIVFRFRRSL